MSAVLQHEAVEFATAVPEDVPASDAPAPVAAEVADDTDAPIESTESDEARGGAVAVQLTTLPTEAVQSDWSNTLSMVERAAATIRSYEKRFVQLEKQSRSIADRAAEDHHRLQVQVGSLEDLLKQAEARAAKAETAVRDAEYEEWEAQARAKRAEQRATEAEARAAQAEAYLRRVHELLANL